MNKKQRRKLLKKLSSSNQGEALNETIDGLIGKLKDEVLDSEDMSEVKGTKFAIEKLKSFKRKINIKENSTDIESYE